MWERKIIAAPIRPNDPKAFSRKRFRGSVNLEMIDAYADLLRPQLYDLIVQLRKPFFWNLYNIRGTRSLDTTPLKPPRHSAPQAP